MEDNWPAKREGEPDEIYNQSQQIRGLEARRYEYIVLNVAFIVFCPPTVKCDSAVDLSPHDSLALMREFEIHYIKENALQCIIKSQY